VKPFTNYRDTVILSWLQDENRTKQLKELGSLFFGQDAKAEQAALKQMMRGETKTECYARLRAQGLPVAEAREKSVATKRTWADLTAQEIAPYAEQDAKHTYDLYDRLLSEAEYDNVSVAVPRMHDLNNVVYRMVKTGVQIDPTAVEKQKFIALREMLKISDRFDVNLDSPKQLSKLIYEDWGLPIKERTDKGEPSTARAALEAMAGSHPGLDEILQYRRLAKSISTYYLPFLDTMDELFRIHPSVNCVGTVTGRFTYSDPNLQTIPRDGTIAGIKECFVATPGKRLWSYDLKSAELRFMASLAGETSLIDALARGEDIYQLTADRIGTSRQVAKSLVLSWPYGVGAVKFSRASGLTVKESRAVIKEFELSYPNLAGTMSKLSMYADIHHRLPLLEPGRFRRFTSPSLQWPVPSYTALNAACQGGVADTMGNVMIEAESYAEANGCSLVLQVHDSLVFEVPIGLENDLLVYLQQVLDRVNPLSMPLVWEMKQGV
jgi:DNA polymerase-1